MFHLGQEVNEDTKHQEFACTLKADKGRPYQETGKALLHLTEDELSYVSE